MNYQEILDNLSENDREFCEGVNYESFEDINIAEMIEANKGLVSSSELENMVKPNKNKMIRQSLSSDPYTRKIQLEMINAEKESIAFNKRMNFKTSYENMDDEFNDEVDDIGFLNLFDELND